MEIDDATNSNLGGCFSLIVARRSVNLALEEVDTMHKQLSSAMSSYLSSCTALRATCLALPRYSVQDDEVEEALMFVGSTLDWLSAQEKPLHDMRIWLTVLRNQSTSLSPISKIPSEILAHVFALSGPSCVLEKTSQSRLYNFSRVCTYWRQVALDTPDLWVHVDIRPDRMRNEWTRLLFERTRDGPIHLHLREPKLPQSYLNRYKYETHAVVETISPHIHRVRRLDLDSDSISDVFIRKIVALWLEKGDPGLARSLSISRAQCDSLIRYDTTNLGIATPGLSESSEKVLKSLSTLCLQGVVFNWNSAAYHGLTDLRLSLICESTPITLPQLHNLLSSSPSLVTLKLAWLDIELPAGGRNYLSPIVLNNLETLNLMHLDPESQQLLLPLLALPDSFAEFRISLSVDLITCDIVTDFLRRLQMNALYLSCWEFGLFLPWPFIFAPRLAVTSAVLVLHMFDLTNIISTDYSSTTTPQFTSHTRFTKVILYDCVITLEALEALVTKTRIRNLHLKQCLLPIDSDSIRGQMQEKYPGLKCRVSDNGFARGSPEFEVFS